MGKFISVLGSPLKINRLRHLELSTTTKKSTDEGGGGWLPRLFSTVRRPIRPRSGWFRPQEGRRRWYPRSDHGRGPVGRGGAGHEGGYCPAEDMPSRVSCRQRMTVVPADKSRSHVQTTERRDFSDRLGRAGLMRQDCRADLFKRLGPSLVFVFATTTSRCAANNHFFCLIVHIGLVLAGPISIVEAWHR